jgi:signal peptidase
MRRLGHYLSLGVLGLLFVGWALVLRPASLGGPATYVIIRGNSMEPAYVTDDLVVVRAADAYVVGDVIAYRVPEGEIGEGVVVVHRIVGGDGTNGYTMRGDNNPSLDPWTPRSGDVVGRAWVEIPQLGRLVAFIHQPVAAGALAAGTVITLLLLRGPSPTSPTRVQPPVAEWSDAERRRDRRSRRPD